MLKKIKSIFFINFFCFFLNIVPSLSQTETAVKLTSSVVTPFDNIVEYTKAKPVSPIVFEDFYGNKVNLEDFFGNLIVINFWATWCKPISK